MSLRMNLYGWSQRSFEQALGSKDSVVLDNATARLADVYKEEADLSVSKSWCRTLIEDGSPLRQQRQPPTIPVDGSLMTLRVETGMHVSVVHCIARAIAREEHLDLSGESSIWAHPAVGGLYRDLASCGFTRSGSCGRPFLVSMSKLSEGTPLFGDAFRTEWSFYTIFGNDELIEMIPMLQAANDFKRTLPKGCPEEMASTMMLCLSDGSSKFAERLIGWFSAIQREGQDAFILWW